MRIQHAQRREAPRSQQRKTMQEGGPLVFPDTTPSPRPPWLPARQLSNSLIMQIGLERECSNIYFVIHYVVQFNITLHHCKLIN